MAEHLTIGAAAQMVFNPKLYLCLTCETVGIPRVRNRGSSAIEIILWFCFIVPGFFYSLWRMGRKDRYCRACKAIGPIPADSPAARRFLNQSHATPATPT
jgi:hypothetical protein